MKTINAAIKMGLNSIKKAYANSPEATKNGLKLIGAEIAFLTTGKLLKNKPIGKAMTTAGICSYVGACAFFLKGIHDAEEVEVNTYYSNFLKGIHDAEEAEVNTYHSNLAKNDAAHIANTIRDRQNRNLFEGNSCNYGDDDDLHIDHDQF